MLQLAGVLLARRGQPVQVDLGSLVVPAHGGCATAGRCHCAA
ncbi:hypothetical protein [Pararhodospirillum photometricum]|nr:hypothetical protein [Pararhodospirillum photometricum]